MILRNKGHIGKSSLSGCRRGTWSWSWHGLYFLSQAKSRGGFKLGSACMSRFLNYRSQSTSRSYHDNATS